LQRLHALAEVQRQQRTTGHDGPGGRQQFRRSLRGEGIVLRLGSARAAAPTAA
jgi:hypothetical protein